MNSKWNFDQNSANLMGNQIFYEFHFRIQFSFFLFHQTIIIFVFMFFVIAKLEAYTAGVDGKLNNPSELEKTRIEGIIYIKISTRKEKFIENMQIWIVLNVFGAPEFCFCNLNLPQKFHFPRIWKMTFWRKI